MTASIDLLNCEVGTVSSMKDGSVKFTVYTAELRPSERGLIMEYHGKACRVAVFPHEGTPESEVSVETERGSKTPEQRLHAALFVLWKNDGEGVDFDTFYRRKMEKFLDHVKAKLP